MKIIRYTSRTISSIRMPGLATILNRSPFPLRAHQPILTAENTIQVLIRTNVLTDLGLSAQAISATLLTISIAIQKIGRGFRRLLKMRRRRALVELGSACRKFSRTQSVNNWYDIQSLTMRGKLCISISNRDTLLVQESAIDA